MTKMRTVVAVLAAASAFALAACSTAASGSPEAGAGSGGGSAVQTAPGDTGSGVSGSGASGSGSASAASGGDEESGPGTTVTISGPLDAQTTHWFDVFCTGLAPMASMDSEMTSVDPTDPKGMQTSYVTLYNTLGDAFTKTAASLQSTPPPTFDKGAEIAGDLVTSLATAGTEMKKVAGQVAAADASDVDSIQTAMAQANQEMSKDLSGLDIDDYELDPKTQDAVDAIPSCKAIGMGSDG